LKTAVANYVRATPSKKRPKVEDLAASFQEAVVDVLVKKTIKAAKEHQLHAIVVGGGVAANSRLRQAFQQAAREEGFEVYLPDRSFCTDNAAMIAAAGYYKLKSGYGLKEGLNVQANREIADWRSLPAYAH